jgi:thioredoxin 1
MPVIKIKEEELESIIPTEGSCIVDYYADWCGPCKMISPILDKLSNDGVTVIKVDTETHPALAKKAGVASIPTLQFYKDGNLTETSTGAIPEAAMRAKL